MFPAIPSFLHFHPIRPPTSLAGISCTPSNSICGVHVIIGVLLDEGSHAFDFEFAAFLHFSR